MMPTPTYKLINSTTLSGSESSITFSNLVQDYRDLILVIEGQGFDDHFYPRLRFNGDTGSNYYWVNMQGNGSSTASFVGTENGQQIGNAVYFSIGEDTFIISQINDYSATDKHKGLITRSNRDNLAVELLGGKWANNSAITSIQLYSANGNRLASGTTIFLYGIEA